MKSCSWLDPSHSSSLEINFNLSFDQLSQVENDCRHHNKAREIKEWRRRDSSYHQSKDTLMGRNRGWSLMLRDTERDRGASVCFSVSRGGYVRTFLLSSKRLRSKQTCMQDTITMTARLVHDHRLTRSQLLSCRLRSRASKALSNVWI